MRTHKHTYIHLGYTNRSYLYVCANLSFNVELPLYSCELYLDMYVCICVSDFVCMREDVLLLLNFAL